MKKDRMYSNIYHNLATMLEAGVETHKCFRTSAGRSNRYGLRKALEDASVHIQQGETIAGAMAHNKKVFGPVALSVISASEMAGNVPNALAQLSRWYTTKGMVKNKVASGMILPFIILHAAIIIPHLVSYIAGMINGAEMSMGDLGFRILRTMSYFYIPIISIFMIYNFMSQGKLRLFMDSFVLKIPTLGKALRYRDYSQFCYIFNMLYDAGVPMDMTAQVATDACGNANISAKFKLMPSIIKQGKTSFEALPRSLPSEFREFWEVGEESGTLYATTFRIANMYEQLANERFDVFSAWFPRLVYLCVSIYVIMQMGKVIGNAFGAYSNI
ncbi:MAG: type II secretion system F family protein [Phycisphaerae bacterium]|nr:type II secretion system F family protein [Phycisphaerae bacterium]